ncbi:hypothetical protein Q3G72_009244 [Acer saccharum]|nr:hypothetical protein Q3G72_009244 [Acer saccharum]
MGQLVVTIENCTKVLLGWNSRNRVSLRSSILRYQGELCKLMDLDQPDTSLLSTEKVSKGSFLWQSIYWGRKLLGKGTRWRIRSGTTISIYDYRWVPRPMDFRIYSHKLRKDIVQVSQLRTALGGWNGQLIREHFDENEAKAILSIPASSNLRSDSVCWHYTSDGEYSVRSGYKLGTALL